MHVLNEDSPWWVPVPVGSVRLSLYTVEYPRSHLVGEVKNGAVTRRANVALALRAKGRAGSVTTERSPADGARDEVSSPHPIRPDGLGFARVGRVGVEARCRCIRARVARIGWDGPAH